MNLLQAVASVGGYTMISRVLGFVRDILIDCLTADLDKRPQSGADLARRFELCLHPRVRELLTPPTGGWQRALVKWPLVGLLVIAIVPNAALSGLNIFYNLKNVVPRGEWTDFERQVQLVNGIAFPIGIGATFRR